MENWKPNCGSFWYAFFASIANLKTYLLELKCWCEKNLFKKQASSIFLLQNYLSGLTLFFVWFKTDKRPMHSPNNIMFSIIVDAYMIALQRCNCNLHGSSRSKLTSLACCCSNVGKPRVSTGLLERRQLWSCGGCPTAQLYLYLLFFCIAGDVALIELIVYTVHWNQDVRLDSSGPEWKCL